MERQEDKTFNATPGRLTGHGGRLHTFGRCGRPLFFCGLFGAFLALTERNVFQPPGRWPVAERLASRRGRLAGAAGACVIRLDPERTRITMGAGDTVFIKRSIFSKSMEALLHGHKRDRINIHRH